MTSHKTMRACVNSSLSFTREFYTSRWLRQRKLQKSNSLDGQNNNFARASHFWYISLPSLRAHDVRVSILNVLSRNKQTRRQIYLSLAFEIGYFSLEFIFRGVHLQFLTKWGSWDNRTKTVNIRLTCVALKRLSSVHLLSLIIVKVNRLLW